MYKLDKRLEGLGMARVETASELDDGDVVVIPSLSDETRLRVSPGTLRKWGLSMCESSRSRYGSARYDAVKRAFGSPGWRNVDAKCLEAHAFIVRDVVRDTNGRYETGTERAPDVEVSFADANSVADVAVVRTRKDPVVTARLMPFAVSVGGKDDGTEVPELLDIFAESRKKGILDALLEAAGPGAFPANRGFSNERAIRYTTLPPGTPDLDATAAMVDVLTESFNSQARHAGMFGIDELMKFRPVVDFRSGNLGPCTAMSRLVMTSKEVCRALIEGEDGYYENYVCEARNRARDLSLVVPAKFLSNILSRGAIAYRSEGLAKTIDRMFARKLASCMAVRYRTLADCSRKICEGLQAELGKVCEIADLFEQASRKLDAGKETEDAVAAFGGEVKW